MKPYQPDNLPVESLNWAGFVRLIGRANAAIARYDGILQGIINPGVLLSPLTTQEAVLSSRIEGTQSTLEEVLEFEASNGQGGEDADIQEIINYRRALRQAVDTLKERPISLNMIRAIHDTLLDSVRGRSKARGEFRRTQNWIGAPGADVDQARFVPPDPLHLMDHLSNLEKYIHHDEEDRLVQLAIIHAQFEIIHPFLDGNGRVGRILIPLFLYEKEVLSTPMFYMSAYLEGNRNEYYDRLLAITEKGDWEGWIRFFLTAVAEQASLNSRKARGILDLYQQKKEKIAKLTRSQFAIQALDTLFDRPIFSTTEFISQSGIPKPSGMRILKTLQREGVIATLREGRGRRPAILLFAKLINLTEGRDVV
jgi:Fic family protein